MCVDVCVCVCVCVCVRACVRVRACVCISAIGSARSFSFLTLASLVLHRGLTSTLHFPPFPCLCPLSILFLCLKLYLSQNLELAVNVGILIPYV